ncbi:MAG: hypothetical protein JXR77_07590 [Lentisphaeria bacterium]|nr:hypothetical protein [Lentisphaeria bacterium]
MRTGTAGMILTGFLLAAGNGRAAEEVFRLTGGAEALAAATPGVELVPVAGAAAGIPPARGAFRVAAPEGALDLTGALTVDCVLRLPALPTAKSPILSKWHCVPGGRSFELGVMPDGCPYFSVSASGNYDAEAREVFGRHALEPGQRYRMTAVFEPGQALTLFVNGVRSARESSRVPRRIAVTRTPVLVRLRPPGELYLPVAIEELVLAAESHDESRVRAAAKASSLDTPPPRAFAAFPDDLADEAAFPPPAVRTITRGPAHHWFAYYDKFQFDESGRFVLGMAVDFEHRSPTADDVVRIGMVDLEDGDRWIDLGTSSAWCWQQGCMLQWRPGHPGEVLWNDREGDRYVCRIRDLRSGRERVLPRAVHHVSPDGRWALCTDMSRVGDMRPGYGYNGIPDPCAAERAPAASGLWRLDLDTGEAVMLISIAAVAAIPYEGGDPTRDKHYFNHIQWRPDGQRFLFLNRRDGGRGTRMFTAAFDGGDLRLVMHGASHYVWRDNEAILIWTGDGYRLYRDDGSQQAALLWKASNGHQTYLPGNEWIVTDTYPQGKAREQALYLVHVPTMRFLLLGRFPCPPEYRGEWRCDTHPRISRDGRLVCFDSPHTGSGRQMHLMDIAPVLDAAGTGAP